MRALLQSVYILNKCLIRMHYVYDLPLSSQVIGNHLYSERIIDGKTLHIDEKVGKLRSKTEMFPSSTRCKFLHEIGIFHVVRFRHDFCYVLSHPDDSYDIGTITMYY